MFAKKSWILGSESLLKYILHKRSTWTKVRKSYDELRWYKNQLEIVLKVPLNSFAREQSCHIYSRIRDYWAIIISLKPTFEQHLRMYKFTTPTDVEMMLYYEYLLHADTIIKVCGEWMTNVGIDIRPL